MENREFGLNRRTSAFLPENWLCWELGRNACFIQW